MNTPTMLHDTQHRDRTLTIGAALLGLALLFAFDSMFDPFTMQIFKLCAINIILALSLNLINGFTGLFSLGHAGFMAVGAYTCALLAMSPAQKASNFVLQPIAPWLLDVHLPFLPSMLAGGLIAGLIAQKLDAFSAAQLGVYLHGLAGDMARDAVGEVSLAATDLLAHVPRAFLSIAPR